MIAINMNKEIEQNSFNDALEIFKINKTNLYNNLVTLPQLNSAASFSKSATSENYLYTEANLK